MVPLTSLNRCIISLLAFALVAYANGPPVSSRGLLEFVKEEIVPDVIDVVPRDVLNVQYGTLDVNFGNELTPFQTKDAPNIWWKANPKKLYVVAFVDPDVPHRMNRTLGEVQHYLVGNIPGIDISSGDVITAYAGPAPPRGSGLHRYTFLVYEQPGQLTFEEQRIFDLFNPGRLRFSIRNFANKYNLGQPIAGNFFYGQWDTYVGNVLDPQRPAL